MRQGNARRGILVLSLTMALALGNFATLPVSAQGNGNAARTIAALSALSVPVVGTVSGTVAGTFQGVANITGFAVNNGNLVAVGTLTGAVTNAAGVVVQSIAATFSVPITPIGTVVCEVLNLQLGPIHLDLLGLVIDTNRILVNITAVPGAGNLLGNLLCAVTHLLDGGVSLQRIASLLNGILAAL